MPYNPPLSAIAHFPLKNAYFYTLLLICSCPQLASYIREKSPSGPWRYRRIKQGRRLKTGDLTGPFFVRPTIDGKQVWKSLFAETFAQAKKEVTHLIGSLEVQEPQRLPVPMAQAPKAGDRVPLATAVETYLEQKSGKSQKTIYQYRRTLNEFQDVVGRKIRYLDEITENVVRAYKKSMEAEGYAGKTIDTRLNNAIAARIPRDEMPVVEEEVAVPYTDHELTKLFAAMDDEEQIRYKFFLGSGCRDKEVTFAA
jgi:hypothetical protein